MLVVTDKFAPHAGGTAVLWSNWCNNWDASAFTVITSRYSNSSDYDGRVPYPIIRTSYLDIPKIRMPHLWFNLFLRCVYECRRGQDLLHSAQILETGLYAPWIKRRYGTRYIVHTYGEELKVYSRNPRLLKRMQSVLRYADAVTAVSSSTAGILRTVIGYSGDVTVVYPGVDTVRFVPGNGGDIRSRMALPEGPLLLTASRLMQRKGIDTVLAAMPSILANHPQTHYVIAGAGPDEMRLRQLVQSAGLQTNVTFTGRVSNEDMVLLMQAAHAFVMPNRELANGDIEGFGIVFLEANACGTPVIGGNSGGAPEAINDGISGYVVDPSSPEQLREKVCDLLSDSDLRASMSLSAIGWASEFTWKRSADIVWELSQQVIHR